MITSTKSFIFIIATLFAFAAFPVYGEVVSPTEQLKPTLQKIIDILQDTSLKGKENKKKRRDVIMSTISDRFDFREMSKRVLGATWREIDEKEKDNFTKQMTKLLENNYIGQLENYSGQTVEYVGERVKNDRAQVSTLVENNGEKYPVHYIMSVNDGKWMVYDINIEGVSLIRNYRAEFTSILRQRKYEGLMVILEQKNNSFEQ
jgi:phospholipid transport system substrate-binding protein